MFAALKREGLWPEREYYVEYRRPEAQHARPTIHFLDLALFCRERNLDVECDGDNWHIGRESAKRVYWNHFGAGEAQGSWPDFGGRPWTNQGFGLPVEIVFRA